MPTTGNYFHLHLVSDSTGETLITVARAVAAQYANVTPVEHVYPLVRSQKQLDRVLDEIEEAPGIVLFTLLEKDLVGRLEAKCKDINIPSLSIIGPVMQLFEAYLGAATTGRVGAQHVLNAEYFKRIDALNYTMIHDDGQHVEGLEDADVVLVGVSRTSKTPTSIYLANRGIRTANVPLVPGIPLPHQLETLKKPLVVSLHATPERLIQVRQNRLLSMGADSGNDDYIDRQSVADEVAFARRLSAKFSWAQLDVTRRSIEETAAAVLKLFTDRQRQRLAGMIFRDDHLAWKRSVDPGLAKPCAANAAGQCRHSSSKPFPPTSTSAPCRRNPVFRRPARSRRCWRAKRRCRCRSQRPGRFVVGADQTLALGKRLFSKPAGRRAGRGAIARACRQQP